MTHKDFTLIIELLAHKTRQLEDVRISYPKSYKEFVGINYFEDMMHVMLKHCCQVDYINSCLQNFERIHKRRLGEVDTC